MTGRRATTQYDALHVNEDGGRSRIGVIAACMIALAACNAPSPELSAQQQGAGNADTTRHRLTFKSGIRAILQDAVGNVWFGSHSEGAAMFDGRRLRYYTTRDGLTDMRIHSIMEDAQGGIWFEGLQGLSRSMYGVLAPFAVRAGHDPEPWSSAPTDLWFNAPTHTGANSTERDPGVYRYDGISLHYHTVPIGKAVDPERDVALSTPPVHTTDGTVWFGSYGAVVGFKDGTFKVITDATMGLDEATGRLHVRSLFADSKGNLWIGNNGIGVIRYDGTHFEQFSLKHGLVSPNSARNGDPSPAGTLEHVFAIGEDANGNLWFGDRDTGAWKYDGRQFTNYTQANGLTTTHIWTIYRDRRNTMLFGMADGSVCRWTGARFVRAW
jgi:ligand-binding sensor domain-containing protein